MIVIAAGVFSVIVSQVTRMPLVLDSELLLIQSNQLILFKTTIITNALGMIFGAIYLYTDIRSERDLVDKLSIQRLHLLLNGTNRYKNVIPSDTFRLFFYCKKKQSNLFFIIRWSLGCIYLDNVVFRKTMPRNRIKAI